MAEKYDAHIASRQFLFCTEALLKYGVHILAHPFRIFPWSGMAKPKELYEPVAELLRRCGVAVRDIGPLLSTSPAERAELLARHLDRLRDERRRLARLIATVERTLATLEGEDRMADDEKFEGFKRDLVEANEKRHGAEARGRYGDDAVDESNRKMLKMSKQEYGDFRALEEQIRSELERAVDAGDDPAGETGERICDMHRAWLGFTWPSYSAEAHRALAESYVADDRFRSYYDRSVEGCAAWLRAAILAHAR